MLFVRLGDMFSPGLAFGVLDTLLCVCIEPWNGLERPFFLFGKEKGKQVLFWIGMDWVGFGLDWIRKRLF
jgi:hypothetical protein